MKLTKTNFEKRQQPVATTCDKRHCDNCYRCHPMDGEKIASWAFSTLGFFLAVFLLSWVCLEIWTHSIGAPPRTAAQITAQAQADTAKRKSDQAEEQTHINECLKIGAYWDNSDSQECRKP